MMAEYRSGVPFTVEKEQTAIPDRFAYRLRIHTPPPVALSTLIGDALHNLRSSLDSLAFGLAVYSLDRPLTEQEERAVEFPICESPAEFDAFFGARRDRAGLYNHVAKRALRGQQSFAIAERIEVWPEGEDAETHYTESFQWDGLNRLRHLNNVDKHRHLTVMAWWPQLVWWGSSEEGTRRLLRGDGTLADGSVLWYLEGRDDGGSDLQHDFALVLTNDRGHEPSHPYNQPTDCVELLTYWHGEVQRKIGWIIDDIHREQ